MGVSHKIFTYGTLPFLNRTAVREIQKYNNRGNGKN